MHVVHHLPDPVTALRDLGRLLAPHGVLAVAEGGPATRFLPGGYGVSWPSFVNRLEATLSDYYVQTWSLTEAAVDRFSRIQQLIGNRLSDADAAALARLLDPDDPAALANRPDLFMLGATTFHLATQPH